MNPKEFYEIYWKAGGYVTKVYPYSKFKKAYIKNIKLSNKKILDVGCGDGEFSSLFSNNNQVFGLDISEIAVKIAQEKGIHAEYFDIDKEGLPFEDNFFDVVLIFDTLEHVFDPSFVLRESYRVLKEGGTLYCAIPNASMIVNRIRFLFTGVFRDCTVVIDKINTDFLFSDHIRLFSTKIIKSLLIKNKFSIKKVDYWFPEYFENSPYNKFSWIARAIVTFKLEKLFPNWISFNTFIEASKKSK